MASLEARLYGKVKRITIKEGGEDEPPATELVIQVKASDGYSLDGLVGLLSDITISPKQQVMDGVR